MHIGSIPLAPGAALAPMAGVSDATMRSLCARYGAAFTVSEMVSAKALVMKDKKSLALLRCPANEAPYGVQVFGYEADVMAAAVQRLEAERFDFLDLNMGCPAPKIVGHGAGSALLKTPALAGEIAAAAVKASSRPVTAKLRVGWDDETMTGAEVARRLEAAGVCLITVHGRTREQMYKPGVRCDEVAKIKAAVSIPVLYNGDVEDAEGAQKALDATGCDGVMIGRGAAGRPWVFRQLAAFFAGEEIPPEPSLRVRMAVMDEQVQGMCAEKGEDRAMREARGVCAAYMRGLRGAASLRRIAHGLTYYTDLAALVHAAYEYNAGNLPEGEEE